MGMTVTEKILAAHCGRENVKPGELIQAKVDLVLANDVTAPIAIREFKKIGGKKVFDRERVTLVPDHYVPNKDIKSAEQAKILRDFSREQGLKYYFEVGEMGVEHALLPEKGLVGPGDLVIGADSHTCTYGALGAFSTGVGSTDAAAAMYSGRVWFKVPESVRFQLDGQLKTWVTGKDIILYIIGRIGVDGALYKAMEFCGSTVENLDIEQRMTICNMAIEAGGKNGIIAPDDITLAYVKDRAVRDCEVYRSDPDSRYCEVHNLRAEDIELQVSFPNLPENSRPVSEAGKVEVDQVVIGSCTNGRISDLRQAAQVIKGRKVKKGLRVIIIPATPSIYRQAMDEGLFAIFLDAGAVISTPTCGPCLGGYMGILAAGEKALATTNRNFNGRMGDLNSEVYLSGPAVAAATAVTGRICGPDDL
ncbi:MAG: 3-isopropylmalate dehydratase large subunit [bacterium]